MFCHIRIHINVFLILLLSGATVKPALSQVISPFNNKAVHDTLSSGNYSFIVAGHLHGASFSQSGFPAATLLANIDSINNLNALFFVSLGDLFLELNEENILRYKKSFFDKLKISFFNVVGNHDVRHELYEKHFGKTYYSFSLGKNTFIFLDTEMDDGSITGRQLEFFQNGINLLTGTDSITHFFIFSHRPVWAENNPRYENLFAGNTRTLIGKNNFETDIRPVLETLAKHKNIFWCSGSLAGSPVSFFYDKDPAGITFINTGIRDERKDGILLVRCDNGNVSFNTISLTGQALSPLENYSLDFWKKLSGTEPPPFNYRLVPYYVKLAIAHPYFWYGVFACFFMIAVVYGGVLAGWRKK
ncbi:MAG: hypothetical protein HYY40_03305 [Bacteroidetes bacterium]|nr:hypothetical protein [Bacteroidota bacterium]